MKKRTSLQLIQLQDNSSRLNPQWSPSQPYSSNNLRKPALKPFNQRLASQKSLQSENDPGKQPSERNINPTKSNKNIKFKKTNQFEKFTYVKGGKQNEVKKGGQRNRSRSEDKAKKINSMSKIPKYNKPEDGECCAVM